MSHSQSVRDGSRVLDFRGQEKCFGSDGPIVVLHRWEICCFSPVVVHALFRAEDLIVADCVCSAFLRFRSL